MLVRVLIAQSEVILLDDVQIFAHVVQQHLSRIVLLQSSLCQPYSTHVIDACLSRTSHRRIVFPPPPARLPPSFFRTTATLNRMAAVNPVYLHSTLICSLDILRLPPVVVQYLSTTRRSTSFDLVNFHTPPSAHTVYLGCSWKFE